MDLYLYFLPLILFIAGAFYLHHRRHQRSESIRQQALEEGLAIPVSLHPVIDRNRCVGCKSCIYACPQQLGHNVLGLYHGKAELLEAANCVGHGACRKACPEDAITLVFGSEHRGVDIPQLDDHFETNVKGIYIAGELGGMGLIRNAIEQGKSAVKAVAESLNRKSPNPFQLVIVGAGPAGIAATLAAHEKGLKYKTFDQESLGGTVFQYPRGKVVMTQPVKLPIVGKMQFRETSKENLLDYWRQVEHKSGIQVSYNEGVSEVNVGGQGFCVKTTRGEYHCDRLLLAIGRRGTPRKLGVPGEELSKVVYRLIDSRQYQGKKVLVVGGGDSALEAALAIADEPGSEVSISYRSDSFARAKQKNRDKVEQYATSGKIGLYLSSNVASIDQHQVTLTFADATQTLDNDAVIINAGGILPNAFLKKIGIEVETHYGQA